MTIATQREQIRTYLEQFAFGPLFLEALGWNRYTGSLTVEIAGSAYTLRGVAEKKGVAVLVCAPDGAGGIPDYDTRKKIEEQVARSLREHLLIFVNAQQTQQAWLWVRRRPGQRAAYRGEHYFKGQSGERLVQRLEQIAIDMDDEETLTLVDVTLRLEKTFDVERVTKKFYERFQTEHRRFEQVISGIADEEMKRWYASLMLNRLMFTYFIQGKRFLDGNPKYLTDRLARVQALGPDRFHSFYRGFLLHLFHDGLGKPPTARQLAPDLAALIGKVPYLNGGLFEVHQIERDNRAIAIPDSAFEHIFAFFDEYDWRLDDRPLRDDKQINPDVLGYIFEKYINQKQMGAYYTKEDITGYISRNTILPFLFDRAREQCAVAFQPDGEVWRLLRDDPDRYIYAAVRHGVDDPLPAEIAAGESDVSQRGGWNRPAPTPFALPTETWREHVARRARCLDLRERLASGGVIQINDLITYNLDIEQFALDTIERCEGPDLLRAFWQAITSVTVLDPTCGSGAFLFAALKILEPLYDACLTRMQAFRDDFDRNAEPQKGQDFRAILDRVNDHPNRRYFILKSIIINNLYGVDIMAEAGEIAKLRLFLTLVAEVNDVEKLEPLPDIDFNIRAGNTLVGFTTLDAVRQAMTFDVSGHTRKLLLDPQDEAALTSIESGAAHADEAYQRFRALQSEHVIDAAALHAAKTDLRQRLATLRDTLDHYLAREYGIAAADDLFAFTPWRASHQPLHWFVEFYGIIQGHGGFDVIIGNPPYVERSKFKDSGYAVRGFVTSQCSDIYAMFIERSLQLSKRQGTLGFIVPISIACTDDFAVLQDMVFAQARPKWMAHYANRPSQLFVGAQKRLTILTIGQHETDQSVYTTRYYRWSQIEREYLMDTTEYTEQAGLPKVFTHSLAKIGSAIGANCALKAFSSSKRLSHRVVSNSDFRAYYVRTPGYFCQFYATPPMVRELKTGQQRPRGELYSDSFHSHEELHISLSVLNSTLFYWYVFAYSDARHMNRRDVLSFPIDFDSIGRDERIQLATLSERLQLELRTNMGTMYKSGLEIQTFDASKSKPIIDEIDRVLARHYGFTDEELDFIINYDIKYRMGQETADDSDTEE